MPGGACYQIRFPVSAYPSFPSDRHVCFSRQETRFSRGRTGGKSHHILCNTYQKTLPSKLSHTVAFSCRILCVLQPRFLTFPQKPKKIIHSGLRSAAIHPVYSQQNQRCFVIWNPLPVVHPDRFWLECSFVLSSKSSELSFSHKPEKGFHPNQSLPFPICVFGLSMLPTSENYLIVYSQEICLFVGLSLCDYKIS